MKGVELYAQVRFAVQIECLSRREAARRYGIDPRTVAKMLAFPVPPRDQRSRPPASPKLDPLTGIIDWILLLDEGRPKKQRHTAKRVSSGYAVMACNTFLRWPRISPRVAMVTTTSARIDHIIDALERLTEGGGSDMFLFTDQARLAATDPLDLACRTGKRE
jgi:hypothetical protein